MDSRGASSELPESGLSSMILPPVKDPDQTMDSVVPPFADLKLNSSPTPVQVPLARPAISGWDTIAVPLGAQRVCFVKPIYI